MKFYRVCEKTGDENFYNAFLSSLPNLVSFRFLLLKNLRFLSISSASPRVIWYCAVPILHYPQCKGEREDGDPVRYKGSNMLVIKIPFHSGNGMMRTLGAKGLRFNVIQAYAIRESFLYGVRFLFYWLITSSFQFSICIKFRKTAQVLFHSRESSVGRQRLLSMLLPRAVPNHDPIDKKKLATNIFTQRFCSLIFTNFSIC